MPAGRVQLVLDTDIGTNVDDAIALALVLASPELDLRAVTTVSGDVELRGRIARKLLALGGRPDVQVAAGASMPILRQPTFRWHGHEGDGILTGSERLPPVDADAGVLLREVIGREHPHVVAIGPLSNLAVALMRAPDLAAAVPQLTVMGGFLGRARDLPLPPTEYNLASDPAAASTVLGAGIPTTLVPLDVTLRVYLTHAELTRLKRARSALVALLCDAIERLAPLGRGWQHGIVAFLHDPLAVATLLEPSLVTFETLHLRPDIGGGVFTLREDPTAPGWRVAVAVDAPRFVEFLLDRLLAQP